MTISNLSRFVSTLVGSKYVLAALLLVIALVVLFVGKPDESKNVSVDSVRRPEVSLTTSAAYAGEQTLSVIGTARAFSEANISAERGGRVTAVSVELGQRVGAGAVVATLENASERAALLQAEGVYEAAEAAAAQSGIGVDEAQNAVTNAKDGVVSTLRSAYNTTNAAVLNSVDDFFADPQGLVLGLRIDGKGYTEQLNAERAALQTLLPEWQKRASDVAATDELDDELDYAEANVERVIALVDTFLTVFSRQTGSDRYSESEVQEFVSEFTALRGSLIGVRSTIDNARSGLPAATDALRRAELTAQGSGRSAVDAQVKQALGALRAAEANLAKTIIRSPISGTVNSLNVKTGDFLSATQPVAVVANNSALEIVTYLSDAERALLSLGDTVMIDGSVEGTVVNIAPAVDSATGKIEVRIAAEGSAIVNGDTVRITKTIARSDEVTMSVVEVPLTAVKFEATNGSIFVVEDDVLVAKPVELGQVRGGSVEVVSGLSADEAFVVDVRGLSAGTAVTVAE